MSIVLAPFSIFAIISLLFLSNPCTVYAKDHNISVAKWVSAGATWYGAPTGFGSDGGACGYTTSVQSKPFSSMIAAGNPTLFRSGKGCGECYQVMCNAKPECSKKSIEVVITDLCPPGGQCTAQKVHFDLSGTAFGALAKKGKENELRNVGILPVLYKRVECDYPGYNLIFKIDAGSNPYYLAVLIEYERGDGDLSAVSLKDGSAKSKEWKPMNHSWGAIWKLDAGTKLTGPLSIKITTMKGKKLKVKNVIPVNWGPGQTYRAKVNF